MSNMASAVSNSSALSVYLRAKSDLPLRVTESHLSVWAREIGPEWVVIGIETACGDPIFISQESPHPVFSAIQGEGAWEPKLVAPSLKAFRDCLVVFRRFASGRSSPVNLEANPPTLEELAQFFQAIRQLTNGDEEALGFWAVQVEVDLDSYKG
ncbi:MAG: hypothetical protein JWO80_372 [Bryobacterales bacterium]|nr:hypothetical protein [Bryobacterales bacterium]